MYNGVSKADCHRDRYGWSWHAIECPSYDYAQVFLQELVGLGVYRNLYVFQDLTCVQPLGPPSFAEHSLK